MTLPSATQPCTNERSTMPRRWLEITDLYVIPAARRVGVGESLILAIEAWAHRRALVGLDSLALPGDRDTKNFFETFGWSPRPRSSPAPRRVTVPVVVATGAVIRRGATSCLSSGSNHRSGALVAAGRTSRAGETLRHAVRRSGEELALDASHRRAHRCRRAARTGSYVIADFHATVGANATPVAGDDAAVRMGSAQPTRLVGPC